MLEGLVFLDIAPFKTRMSVSSLSGGGGVVEGLCGSGGLHSRLLKMSANILSIVISVVGF